MNAATEHVVPAPAGSRLWRPPWVGIITTVLMIIGIALGHAIMRAIEVTLGDERTYVASIYLGAASIVALWYGVRSRNETFATWMGFFAGLFVWMTWVEFFYMYFARQNFGIMPRMLDDGIRMKPEYMIMSATAGVLLFMLAYFIFDKDTRCNMFVWIQNRLGLRAGLGETTKRARDRNYANITFIETIFVTWFCYEWTLALGEPAFFGSAAAAKYASIASMVVATIWGGFCFSRLINYRRTSTALRYAIPTANVLWVNVEVLSKLGLLKEVWLEPWNYPVEMSAFVGSFGVLVALIVYAPKKPSEIASGARGSEPAA
jgi:hypothetical protein